MKKNQNKQVVITLAEAYLRVIEIDNLLSSLRSAVTRVSTSKVSTMFTKVSALLSEHGDLKGRIRKTEYSFTLSGTPVCDLKMIIENLEERIKFFSLVSKRTDLSENTIHLIEESTAKFLSTKENLVRKYDEAVWEIELL